MTFADRADAGWKLAEALEGYRGLDVVVLGLPRGGVPVAYQVACALDAPLDVIIVRKLGVPFQPEVAMGAIGEDGIRVLDHAMVTRAAVSEVEVGEVERREQEVLAARLRRYRRGRERVDLHGRMAIVVDDGVATGSTARAASRIARLLGATQVVLAVPVGPPGTLHDLAEADAVVAIEQPADFRAVGFHYNDFSPTSDDEVVVLLDRAARRVLDDDLVAEPVDCDIDVEFAADGVVLQGHLHLPDPSAAVVVFAHGSGSSRHSPRNRLVADVLYRRGHRHLPPRSPLPVGGERPAGRLRRRPPGPAPGRRHDVGARAARGPGDPDRLLRGQYRRRGRPRGGGRVARLGGGGGVPGWSSGPGPGAAVGGDRPDTARCRKR